MNRDCFEGCAYLLLALLGAFVLGTYACHFVYGTKKIESTMWLVTSSFTLLFLGLGIQKIQKS